MARFKMFISTLMAVLLLTASYAMAGGAHTGTVIESLTGGGYTYMDIEEDGKNFWIAGPQTPVSKGARVTFSEQIWMANFTSKALGRTFDRILFVSGVQAASTMPAPQAQKRGPATEAAAQHTVGELHSKKLELKGHAVRVRGKVVKVSENIMGRTWVHIQDGTGAKGSDTVIFMSINDSAAVGSVVTAEGTLETDKDFGFGYFYPIIVEDSTFSQ